MTTVELFAGLAAWTLNLHGARPPASRIGAKTGYAGAISRALGVRGRPERVVLVDADQALVNAMRHLLHEPKYLANAVHLQALAGHRKLVPYQVWTDARERRHLDGFVGAAAWWLYTSGARGGVGGFKGEHKLRPSVDGFIPSRESLVARLGRSPALPHVDVVCADATLVEPIPGAVVYMDPPYEGRQGYGAAPFAMEDVVPIARRWHAAGCKVAISYDAPLAPLGWPSVEITEARFGQTRRSLTRSHAEWLTVSPGET